MGNTFLKGYFLNDIRGMKVSFGGNTQFKKDFRKSGFARFYKRYADRTKSVVGACSQTAEFSPGCIARQRVMSM